MFACHCCLTLLRCVVLSTLLGLYMIVLSAVVSLCRHHWTLSDYVPNRSDFRHTSVDISHCARSHPPSVSLILPRYPSAAIALTLTVFAPHPAPLAAHQLPSSGPPGRKKAHKKFSKSTTDDKVVAIEQCTEAAKIRTSERLFEYAYPPAVCKQRLCSTLFHLVTLCYTLFHSPLLTLLLRTHHCL
jgi:hypothetical protein